MKALAIIKHHPMLLCQLALVEQKLNEDERALELLKKACDLAPRNATTRFHYAQLLFNVKKLDECLEELSKLKVGTLHCLVLDLASE